MKELQRRQKIRKMLYSLPVLALLLVLTGLMVRGTVRVVLKEMESAKQLALIEEKAAALSLRSQELEGKIARLETEEGVIEEIKEKFSVSEEGERVAIIVDDRYKATSTDEEVRSWYGSLWNTVKGLWQW